MKKRFVKFISVIAALLSVLTFFACKAGNAGSDNVALTQYAVEDAYFSKAMFGKERMATVDLKGGPTTYKYYIEITSYCSVSVYEYSAAVDLLSANGDVLLTETVNKTKDVGAGEELSFGVEVSKEVQAATSAVKVVFGGKSYLNPKADETVRKYAVTFAYNNGQPDTASVVNEGKTIAAPTSPDKSNYVFDGWYDSRTGGAKFDFSKPITKNVALYAKFKLDENKINDKIFTELIKGIVKIRNVRYGVTSGSASYPSTAEGLGFCFRVSNGNYYILTNNSVAYKGPSYENQKITVEDYKGKTYEGYVYKNPNKSFRAAAAAYDLACIYFRSSSTDVESLNFSKTAPYVNEDVITLGSLKTQNSNIVYGSIGEFKKVTVTELPTTQSNVQFDVINHNAFIDQGLSGAPLFNADLQVVGVNYAVNSDSKTGFAIPVEKIYEFLSEYVYN